LHAGDELGDVGVRRRLTEDGERLAPKTARPATQID